MTELPKIVVNQLAGRDVRPEGTAHPDADLLTAFVERALGDRERGWVVSHLAECAPCRDIVTFAQPDAAEAPVAIFTPKPFWSGRLLWRWGALAACAVLAVALAVHRAGSHAAMVAEQRNSGPLSYKQAGKPSPSVANESPVDKDSPMVGGTLSVEPRVAPLRVEPAAPVTAQSAAPAAPQMNDNKGLVAENTVTRKNDPVVDLSAGSAIKLRRDSERDQTTTEYAYSAPKSEIAPNSELALKKDQARTREATAGAQVAAAPVVAQNAPAQASVEASTTTAYAPTDKDEFRASSAPIAGMAKAKLSAARPATTWQITDGNLQRSFDGGKSWESVSLNQPVRARVVATVQFHVWVGANGGLLFHSIDGGEHFAAVKVADKVGGKINDRQAVLTGDIVALAFADAQDGRLETAAHEVWTTADGGQTWNRP